MNKKLGKIPVVSIPRNLQLPRLLIPTPLWDTEWWTPEAREVEFFQRGQGSPFQYVGGVKDLSDTNIVVSDENRRLVPTMNAFLLDRIVMYPTFDPVATEEFRAAFERFRLNAVLTLRFGCTPFGEWPLRDAMPALPDPRVAPTQRLDAFAPSEAPDLNYRRGIDVTVLCAADGGTGVTTEAHPLRIQDRDDVRIGVRVEVPCPGRFALRCYLVGMYLKSIQG